MFGKTNDESGPSHGEHGTERSDKRLTIALIIITAIVIILFGVGIYLGRPKTPVGAVVTNGVVCAKIATSILEKGGSAVDAMIAAMLCDGVVMPQAMGIGGGFMMTIYIKEENKAYFINARDVAPLKATKDMFVANTNLSKSGILAIAVPGELRGLWFAYKKFGGKLPWKELVQPSIDLCTKGIKVTKFYEKFLTLPHIIEIVQGSKILRSIFYDSKINDTLKFGQRMKFLQFAKTLEIIRNEGGDALHDGSLTEDFVKEITELGGIITVEDMKNYKPVLGEPVTIKLPEDKTLYTTNLPGSGLILALILNILKNFLDISDRVSVTNFQRIVESFKFAYAKRSELGDLDFVPIQDLVKKMQTDEYALNLRKKINDSHTSNDIAYYGANFAVQLSSRGGTAPLGVLASNGDAVSVTSTVNFHFGSGVVLEKSGIILNNQMDDFSIPGAPNEFGIPPSEANFIVPGKRPLSSMVPSIIVDKNKNVELIVGSAGGSRIITTVAMIIIRHLWFNQTIYNSIKGGRMHHQLVPMNVEIEKSLTNLTMKMDSKDLAKELEALGHNFIFTDTMASAALAISTKFGVESFYDERRTGNYAFIY